MTDWEIVIGLETHAQLTTASKIFSGASTSFGAPPNTQASAVDLALPGTLPLLNKGAVERAIRFGLAVSGNIAATSVFARKNYFYPDLPKGYQISQFEQPVVSGGSLTVLVGEQEKVVRLTRAHLEEDAGKLLHEEFRGMTGVDLNRAGTPLLEIVSEPDMRSAAEAVAYAKALHSLVRWIGICDGNMQEGSFRCDANVSVRRPGAELGTRCEIKNLNSFRFLEKAIEYEARRQVGVLEEGGRIVQETRLFDPDKGETRPMRSKEDAQDYRYFPDPDLLPLEISAAWIDRVAKELPELPVQKRKRFADQFNLSPQEIATLTSSFEMSRFFEEGVKELLRLLETDELFTRNQPPGIAKAICNWVVGEISSRLNSEGVDISDAKVTPAQIARLNYRVFDNTLSNRSAKEVFTAIWKNGGEVDEVVKSLGLTQISDSGALEAVVEQVLAAQPKLVEDYRAGKEKAFNALVGQVMKATGGKANPAQVNAILKRRLAAS
jgi:aspartyl-tRNA(Asn)/glutamyl-tRNA(Gln) amidotransferase subunit B